MKNKTILIAHNYYRNLGGEDISFESEVEKLKKKGNKVIVYKRNNIEINNFSFLKKLLLPLRSIWSFKTYFDIRKIIKTYKPDFIYIQNTFPLISPSIYYAAKSLNTPIIQTLRNYRIICPSGKLYFDNKIDESSINKLFPLKAIIKRAYNYSFFETLLVMLISSLHKIFGTWKKVDAYICLTNFSKKIFKKAGFDEDKIYVKQNFYILKDKQDKNKDKDRVLFIGRLEKEKGVITLLNAWKNIEGLTLRIIGTGNLENTLKSKIKKENIKNIELVGKKSQEEIKREMSQAMCLVFPSEWYETFGRVNRSICI